MNYKRINFLLSFYLVGMLISCAYAPQTTKEKWLAANRATELLYAEAEEVIEADMVDGETANKILSIAELLDEILDEAQMHLMNNDTKEADNRIKLAFEIIKDLREFISEYR